MIAQRMISGIAMLFHGERRQWEPLSEYERARVLQRACEELREGALKRAELIVRSLEDREEHDAVCLNLLGVFHEARQEWRLARHYYGKSVRADGGFKPARQNLRRLYEVDTFGTSDQPVAVGDFDTDRWLASHMKRSRNHP